MTKHFGLAAQRGEKARMVVSERAYPPRRVGIEERSPIEIEQTGAGGASDDQWIGGRDVAPHLGVGVPHAPFVEGNDVAARRIHTTS
jgi:hypothetical protein